MPDKNPERYWKREQIYFQHPEVANMGKLSDALKEGEQHDAARDALAIESAKGPDDETHYGRIRRLNREWNENNPVFREHKVELTPWEKKPYNERALHHHQFGIPNGGGAISSHRDELIVRLHTYKNDDGTEGHWSKLEQVPEGWSAVESVGKALGVPKHEIEAKLRKQGEEYPKQFGGDQIEKRREVGRQFGRDAYKQSSADEPDPFSKKRQN